MKTIIVILFFLSALLVFAQDNVDESDALINDQTNKWMMKIASDSELRVKIMDIMINETQGNKEETMKLVYLMINNQEIHDMIFALKSEKKEHENISIEPRGMMKDSVKSMKMYKVNQVHKK